MTRRLVSATLTLAALGLGVATPADAASVTNGDFERGNLSGWEKRYFPDQEAPFGIWRAYTGPYFEAAPVRGPAPAVPAPPQGEFGAITEQEEVSSQILSQVVRLKADRRHKLRFKLAYSNQNDGAMKPRRRGMSGFITPRTLGLNVPNQQFRMDVMKAGAPIRSVDRDHVLKRVYRTDVGDPKKRGYRTISAGLTRFAGQSVRLRFAVAVTQAPLHAAIDAVKVKTRRLG